MVSISTLNPTWFKLNLKMYKYIPHRYDSKLMFQNNKTGQKMWANDTCLCTYQTNQKMFISLSKSCDIIYYNKNKNILGKV